MKASSATAARRCISIRDVAAVTLRLAGWRRGSMSWRSQIARWKPLPAALRARTAEALMAAAPAVTESASGMGERSGSAGQRLVGPDRHQGPGLVGGADLARLEREGAVAAHAVGRDEPGVEVLDRRLRVERDERVLEGVRPHLGDDVRRDEAQRVADVELAAPDLGLELLDRQAAIAVRVGQGRQAGLADEVGLGRADRRDVQLAAADDGDGDPDRARLVRRGRGRSGRAGGRAACWRRP